MFCSARIEYLVEANWFWAYNVYSWLEIISQNRRFHIRRLRRRLLSDNAQSFPIGWIFLLFWLIVCVDKYPLTIGLFVLYCPITSCRLKSQLNTARTQWNFRPALISAIDLSVGEVHDTTTNTKCFVSYRLYICQIPALHWAIVTLTLLHSLALFFFHHGSSIDNTFVYNICWAANSSRHRLLLFFTITRGRLGTGISLFCTVHNTMILLLLLLVYSLHEVFVYSLLHVC